MIWAFLSELGPFYTLWLKSHKLYDLGRKYLFILDTITQSKSSPLFPLKIFDTWICKIYFTLYFVEERWKLKAVKVKVKPGSPIWAAGGGRAELDEDGLRQQTRPRSNGSRCKFSNFKLFFFLFGYRENLKWERKLFLCSMFFFFINLFD